MDDHWRCKWCGKLTTMRDVNLTWMMHHDCYEEFVKCLIKLARKFFNDGGLVNHY